jgi:hypothetical protein
MIFIEGYNLDEMSFLDEGAQILLKTTKSCCTSVGNFLENFLPHPLLNNLFSNSITEDCYTRRKNTTCANFHEYCSEQDGNKASFVTHQGSPFPFKCTMKKI